MVIGSPVSATPLARVTCWNSSAAAGAAAAEVSRSASRGAAAADPAGARKPAVSNAVSSNAGIWRGLNGFLRTGVSQRGGGVRRAGK